MAATDSTTGFQQAQLLIEGQDPLTCWFNPTGTARPADDTSTYEIRHLNELARLLL